jgi:CelD/BcsL family acetyltransferase involved in cellulose biosynthesis
MKRAGLPLSRKSPDSTLPASAVIPMPPAARRRGGRLKLRLAKPPAPKPPMRLRLEIVDTLAGFRALRTDWQALERRDPEGTVFLSWSWLEQLFAKNPDRWRVFIVRASENSDDPAGDPPGELVCAFPVKYRVHWSASRSAFQTRLEAGGRLLWSEYTGFLCDPDWEEPAITRIARRMQTMPWSRLSIRYEASRNRAKLFTDGFSPDAFAVDWNEYFINKGQTDNLMCPQVALPESFEAYLQDCLSKNARYKIRSFTRRHLDSGELHFTHADAASFARDLDMLLAYWTQKWAVTKGPVKAARVARHYREILSTAQKLGLLFMPVLWRDKTPVGALGHILDPRMKRSHFIVAGRDGSDPAACIGLLLHAHAIEHAIGQNYQSYDFCHGDEPYKYSLGGRDTRVKYFTIRRRGAPAGGSMFDPLSTKEALRRTVGFIKEGETANATAACRQILSAMP